MYAKTKKFLEDDIWRLKASELPKREFILIRVLRVFLLAIKGFNKDKCALYASSLTYFALISIVPIFALVFGIAKGFELEKLLIESLQEQAAGQEEVINYVIEFSQRALDNTKGGLIAGVGILVLFYSVTNLLTKMENAFNHIWGVQESRTLVRKLTDYLAIVVLFPIFLVSASSLNVFINSQTELILERMEVIGFLSPIIFTLLKGLPIIMFSVLFSFLYVVLPNTNIKLVSGIIGGLVGGLLFVIWQTGFIYVQGLVSSYGAIYGSFAALPFFLIWLQISWFIILFGGEVSFAQQNVDTYEFEPDAIQASESLKRLLALRISNLVIKQFIEGKIAPLTAADIGHELEIPIRLTKELLFRLVKANVLLELEHSDWKDAAYHPARDPQQLTIAEVLISLETYGVSNIPVKDTAEIEALREATEEFGKALEKHPKNVSLAAV